MGWEIRDIKEFNKGKGEKGGKTDTDTDTGTGTGKKYSRWADFILNWVSVMYLT